MLVEFIVLIAYLIRSLRNILYHLFWWEKKEYRFDRMIVHLNETSQGKRWLFGPLSLVKWILLIISIVADIDYVIYGLFIFEAIKNIAEIRNGWRIPPFKFRIKAIILLTILSLFFVILLLIDCGIRFAVTLLIGDKLLGPIIALLILVTNIAFNFHKNLMIKKAKKKINQAEKLKIIGITGSYGKTTTKELIAHILSNKYRVLKTLGSQNTDIGIAERILEVDLGQYDYFVCEMAAYKKGEIAAICQMLVPRIEIGVITGINEQHQSLFGNLETTKQAKFELIKALQPLGIAIFNGMSKHINKMILWAKERNLRVIVVGKISVSKYPSRLHGEHFQENLSLSIKVASELGMNKEEVEKAIVDIQLPAKTMNVIKKGKAIYIDDTFNANPDGVYAALKYLKTYRRKRILVLQPLIELGRYTKEVHQKIGRLAAQICDELVLTNNNFFQFILAGIQAVNKGKIKITIGEFPVTLEGNVILFEGKEAEKYLTLLKKE